MRLHPPSSAALLTHDQQARDGDGARKKGTSARYYN